MKLKETQKASIDLVQEELDSIKQADEEFWQSIRELIRYGVPGHDQQGHWAEIRMKVRPLQMDMIAAVREKMPEGWFKNTASLNRAIMAVGCKVLLRLMSTEKGEWHDVLDGLNLLAKKLRLEEFKKDMASLRGNIIECNTMNAQEKVKVADIMAKLEQRFMSM
jgi:hypothetical protein